MGSKMKSPIPDLYRSRIRRSNFCEYKYVKDIGTASAGNDRLVLHPKTCFTRYEKSISNQEGLGNTTRRSRKRRLRTLNGVTCTLISIYAKCSTSFKYSINSIPRRLLTKLSEPAGNFGFDNIENNLILRVHDTIRASGSSEYLVLDLLGQGTFGQVARCQNKTSKKLVAIKVIKNHTPYYNQALIEVRVLKMLNQEYDPDDTKHFVRLIDYFHFRGHLCLVFELLHMNLYELLSRNNLTGFPLDIVRGILRQIVESLVVLGDADVIHCDLKPENIVLTHSEIEEKGRKTSIQFSKVPAIKLIDFGSACMDNRTVYAYIQSRFYRSPEVLLGLPYDGAIDMWSLGCIGAELFLGLPLFPGVSDYDQVKIIIDMIGYPPEYMLKNGINSCHYIKENKAPGDPKYVLKTPEEFAADTNSTVSASKKYFRYNTLEEIINHAGEPLDVGSDMDDRKCFTHFLKGLLSLDPKERWTPRQAATHPFLTKQSFRESFRPPVSFRRQRMRDPMNNIGNGNWELRSSYGLHTMPYMDGPHSYPFATFGDDLGGDFFQGNSPLQYGDIRNRSIDEFGLPLRDFHIQHPHYHDHSFSRYSHGNWPVPCWYPPYHSYTHADRQYPHSYHGPSEYFSTSASGFNGSFVRNNDYSWCGNTSTSLQRNGGRPWKRSSSDSPMKSMGEDSPSLVSSAGAEWDPFFVEGISESIALKSNEYNSNKIPDASLIDSQSSHHRRIYNRRYTKSGSGLSPSNYETNMRRQRCDVFRPCSKKDFVHSRRGFQKRTRGNGRRRNSSRRTHHHHLRNTHKKNSNDMTDLERGNISKEKRSEFTQRESSGKEKHESEGIKFDSRQQLKNSPYLNVNDSDTGSGNTNTSISLEVQFQSVNIGSPVE